jgi:Kdo2-lipid IVA lauroyltransferase/acyltransferase
MARRRGIRAADKVRIVLSVLAAPVLARLPAVLGYRIACWQGDLLFWFQAGRRAEVARNIQLVLGNGVSPAAAQRIARDWFRLAACEAVDAKRLRRGTRPLRRLIEIRGWEHLEAARAAGKGVIMCSAHFGSYESGFSILHASGIPVTTIGRRPHIYTAGLSAAERRFWELVYARPMRRYRQRPNIEPWPGRFQVAALAAAALRANEVVTISIDAPPLESDRARAVEVSFLDHQVQLLPGVVTLARLTGAPVLMTFLYRASDYRHQVWEISAPVPVDGETETAFERCVAEVSAAIRRSPSHWDFWNSPGVLGALGLIQRQPQRDRSPAAEVTVPPGARVLRDGPAGSVPAQD